MNQIQELIDEEDIANSYAPKSGKKFTFNSPDKKYEDDEKDIDSYSNSENNEKTQFLNKNEKLKEYNLKQLDDVLQATQQSKKPILKPAPPIKIKIESEIKEDFIEDKDNDYVLSGRDSYFGTIHKAETKNFTRDSTIRPKKKEKIKVDFPQERLQQYEDFKNEIQNYALISAPKSKKASIENYKTLISDHMKNVEKEEQFKLKDIDPKIEGETKMISTEIETKIRDHIVNHKIRANQKYQVVKNFFRIWFINAKEIRRLEKKQSQKQNNNQMVADKILQEEQEQRQKRRFLNEKSLDPGQMASQKQVKKVKNTTVGQLYIKPGYDIKLFIPFCTDIYLGKD